MRTTRCLSCAMLSAVLQHFPVLSTDIHIKLWVGKIIQARNKLNKGYLAIASTLCISLCANVLFLLYRQPSGQRTSWIFLTQLYFHFHLHFHRTDTIASIFTRLDHLILSNTARHFQDLIVPCFTLTPQLVLLRNQTREIRTGWGRAKWKL